jgi:hypothetical protein
MGLNHSPRIVTEGLMMCLDAANRKSYPGSGTSWTDISIKANTATLVGSPTYSSGAITFNPSGTGQYANIPIAAIPSGSNLVSVCCWINLGNPGTPPNASVFCCSEPGGSRIINIHLPWNDSVVYWDAGNSGGTFNRINTSTLTTAQKTGWHNWTFTKNALTGNMNIYLNGTLWHSGTGKTKVISIIIEM